MLEVVLEYVPGSYILSWDDLSFEYVGSLPMGCILLSVDWKLVRLNETAKSILRAQTEVRIEKDHLTFVRPADTNSFKKLVNKALADRVTCSMAVKRDRCPPLTLLISSFYKPAGTDSHFVAVFLGDPAMEFVASVGRLRNFFDLTPAEARIAVLLLRGATLSQASDTMGITAHTARGHLKNIFLKTGTNRQAQLMYVLLSTPASVHLGKRKTQGPT